MDVTKECKGYLIRDALSGLFLDCTGKSKVHNSFVTFYEAVYKGNLFTKRTIAERKCASKAKQFSTTHTCSYYVGDKLYCAQQSYIDAIVSVNMGAAVATLRAVKLEVVEVDITLSAN